MKRITIISYYILIFLWAIGLCFVACTLPLLTKNESRQQRVNRIYHNLIVKTGVTDMVPPIYIVDEPTINAYNTSSQIFIYSGIIDFSDNDDEIALIIGHEIAHSTLQHFNLMTGNTIQQSILESMADKMGAMYMMRGGYDICKGREIFKKFSDTMGNSIDQNHPANEYRYDELNIGCN